MLDLRKILLATSVLVAIPLDVALAQPSAGEDQSYKIEEVVVTAQRREQSAQSVGIPIAAFSGEQMERLGITNATEVTKFVPGMAVAEAQGGFLSTFAIRGLSQGDYTPFQEGPIAFYSDDVYISSLMSQNAATFDAERIEVEKGPQGTLFGRNSTGGLVQYFSRKPTDHYTGYLDLSGGRFGARQAEAAFGGPITDGVAFRASGFYKAHDPILKNLAGPDGNWSKTYAGRIHLQFKPNDDLKILLTARAARSTFAIGAGYQFVATVPVFRTIGGQVVQVNSQYLPANSAAASIVDGAAVGVRPVAGGNFAGFVSPCGGPSYCRTTLDRTIGREVTYTSNQGKGKNWVNSKGVTLNISYAMSDHHTLTSITDLQTSDWRSGALVMPNASGGPGTGFDTFADEISQGSQEFRINADYERLNWVVGVYGLGIYSNNGAVFGFVAPPNGDFAFHIKQRTRSVAPFAQVEWEFVDDWRLIVGIRETFERKKFWYDIGLETTPWPTGTAPYFNPYTSPLAKMSTNLTSGKVGINYHPTKDLLVYASYNRGTKSGGFNQLVSPPSPQNFPAFFFGAETLSDYELGVKSEFLDSRLRVNANVFYYDYNNYQAYQNLVLNGVTTGLISNAPAKVKGGEVEVLARPAEGLDFALGASYTKAVVKNLGVTAGFFKDVTPVYSPRWQFNGLVRYEWDLSSNLKAAVQADASYRTKYYLGLANFDDTLQKGYHLVNLRADLFVGDRWRLEAAVENLNDYHYKVAESDLAATFGSNITSWNMGRAWTLGVRYGF